jgi:hypothetical protein
MTDPEYVKLAEARIAQQGRIIAALRKAIAPFADIALARDSDESAPDMIDAPCLSVTPEQVRAARLAHEQS